MAETATNERLMLGDDMINRAAKGWWAHESDSDVSWSQVDEAVKDGYRARAEVALYAAFEGVPLTNYGIGLALQSFRYVICVAPAGGALILEKVGDDEFDALAHHFNTTFRKDGSVSSMTFSKIGVES